MKLFSFRSNHSIHPKKSIRKMTKLIIVLFIFLIPTILVMGLFCIQPKSLDFENKGNNSSPSNNHNLDYNIDHGDRISDYFTLLICVKDNVADLTDSIIVGGFDTQKGTLNFMNIPRDTMSNVNRTGASKKINAAYAIGGIEQTKKEVSMLTGFVPDRFVIVNMNIIEELVDLIGGIDYEIPFRMKYDAPDQNLHIDFQPGMQHLDGKEVVEFLRWRQNNPGYPVNDEQYDGSDTSRIKKLQDFLKEASKQVLTAKNVSKIPDIVKQIKELTETDFSDRELIWLCWQLYSLNSSNINMVTLPGVDSYTSANSSKNYWFYIPNAQEVVKTLNECFSPYTVPISADDLNIVDEGWELF